MTSAPAASATRPRVPWLQRAVAAGAGLRSFHVGLRLRPDLAVTRQRAAWLHLLRRIVPTRHGADLGLQPLMGYTEWSAAVAPRPYEHFHPWIERMKAGEPDVLWPGRCRWYAVSSGTTAGRTKFLPVTPDLLAHFRRTGLDSLCFFARRTGRHSVFRGRHLFLGGSTVLAPLPAGPDGFQASAGDLSGIAALHLPRWAERHLYEPGRALAQIADWPAKIRAIAERTAGRDVTLLAGIPSWLLVFAEELRRLTGRATLREVWPNFECMVHGGVPVGPFVRELVEAAGPGVRFHEVYPASEAFIAAQDAEAGAGLRLLTDAGVFYEFLPVDRYDEADPAASARHIVPLEHALPDVDYVLLLTTPAGLVRYVIGDVVRFVSVRPPRLVYVGRTRLQLSAFGEHVIEKELTDAVAAVCAPLRAALANFHVAPRFVDTAAAESRGRHEWWLEWRGPPPAELPPGAFAAALDRELQRRNDDYEAKRLGGGLAPPLVHFVPAGTFEAWLRARGKWGGQHKMPRCRSDRTVADELTACADALVTGT